MKVSKRALFLGFFAVVAAAGSFYSGRQIIQIIGGDRNFVSSLGFGLSDRRVIVERNPTELLYDRHFLKAAMPLKEAVTLRSQFSSRPDSNAFNEPVSPADIPALPGVYQWQPRKVKKSWSGSFIAGMNAEYHCVYLFDITRPGKVTLYFYAIAFIT